MRLIGFVMSAVTSALVLVPVALAQDPTVGVYGGEAGEAQEQLGQAAGAGSVLPFTGLDLALAFGAALVLVAVGVILRRVGQHDA